MKILLIVNPTASAVTPDRRAVAEGLLGHGHDLTVVETLYRGHAIDVAREAAAAGTDVVVALGGDGTVNEAANGLVGTETALAALPGGSTNVFARTIGSPRKVKAAAAALAAALDRPPRRIGLGLVNGRYFLFHVGMGFDAAVVGRVEQKPHLKRSIGQGVFVYAAFATWFGGFDRTHPHLVVRDGDETVVDDGYFAICLNTNPYTYLGARPLNVAPDAGFDQPLTLVTLRTIQLGPFLRLVGSTLGNGRRLRHDPKVDYRPSIERVTVAAWAGDGDGRAGTAEAGRFPYQADGDYLGEAETLSISYEPDRLLLVVPCA
jgi:diacylglycerol kinase family enzyme